MGNTFHLAEQESDGEDTDDDGEDTDQPGPVGHEAVDSDFEAPVFRNIFDVMAVPFVYCD